MDIKVVIIITSCLLLSTLDKAIAEEDICLRQCIVEHPQTRFCSCEFAIAGTVVGIEEKWTDNIVLYRIQLHDVFKTKDLTGNEVEVYVQTPTKALCGKMMNLQQEYLITGTYSKDDKMQIALCDWVVEWDKVTLNQELGLYEGYAKTCSTSKCQVAGTAHLIKLPNEPLWEKNSCKFNPVASATYHLIDCESDCVCVDHDGVCEWEGDNYDSCFSAREVAFLQMNGRMAIRGKSDCKAIQAQGAKVYRNCLRKLRRNRKHQWAQGLTESLGLTVEGIEEEEEEALDESQKEAFEGEKELNALLNKKQVDTLEGDMEREIEYLEEAEKGKEEVSKEAEEEEEKDIFKEERELLSLLKERAEEKEKIEHESEDIKEEKALGKGVELLAPFEEKEVEHQEQDMDLEFRRLLERVLHKIDEQDDDN